MNKNEKRQKNKYSVGKADRWEKPNIGTSLTEYMHVYYTQEWS